MTVIIQFHYNSAYHPAIKKWKQRHPELNAMLYVDHQCRSSRTNIIQIEFNGKNPSEIIPILRYFNKQIGNLFLMKEKDPSKMYEEILRSPNFKDNLSTQPGHKKKSPP